MGSAAGPGGGGRRARLRRVQARAGRVAHGVRHLAQHPCSKLGVGLGLAGRVGAALLGLALLQLLGEGLLGPHRRRAAVRAAPWSLSPPLRSPRLRLPRFGPVTGCSHRGLPKGGQRRLPAAAASSPGSGAAHRGLIREKNSPKSNRSLVGLFESIEAAERERATGICCPENEA